MPELQRAWQLYQQSSWRQKVFERWVCVMYLWNLTEVGESKVCCSLLHPCLLAWLCWVMNTAVMLLGEGLAWSSWSFACFWAKSIQGKFYSWILLITAWGECSCGVRPDCLVSLKLNILNICLSVVPVSCKEDLYWWQLTSHAAPFTLYMIMTGLLPFWARDYIV